MKCPECDCLLDDHWTEAGWFEYAFSGDAAEDTASVLERAKSGQEGPACRDCNGCWEWRKS